jgi:hypothetical protein
MAYFIVYKKKSSTVIHTDYSPPSLVDLERLIHAYVLCQITLRTISQEVCHR